MARPSRRRLAAAGALLAFWAVWCGILLLVGEVVKSSSAVASLDTMVTRVVVAHRAPALNHIMELVTWTGSSITTSLVAVVVAVLAWRRRLPAMAVATVVVAWSGELAAVTLTKAVVERPRPPEVLRLVVAHGWSFPSGHASNAVVVFAAAAALCANILSSRPARVTVWTLAFLATALVGFSRIELGVHWMTDVATSLIWTSAWLAFVVMLVPPQHQVASAQGADTLN